MIEEVNRTLFLLINQYAGLNPLLDGIAIIAAQYMPIIFVIWLSYLWIKKDDKYKDIVLYSVYAAILGIIINLALGFFYFHPRPFMIAVGTLLFSYPFETSFPSDHTTFMLSIALMMTYFKETRKIGIILIILGLTGGFARVFCGVHFPFDIFGSIGVAIISTITIYQFKEKFVYLNQIFKLIYLILK